MLNKIGGRFFSRPVGGSRYKLWHKLCPIPTSPFQRESLYNLGHNLYQLPEGWKNFPLIFRGGSSYKLIIYDLNYTKPPPRTAARISWAYPQGDGWDASPRFWSRGRIYKCPPTTGPNICISVYGIFSHFLKKIIARYASSIAFYKIYVPEIIEIWACNLKTAQDYISYRPNT